MADYSGTIADRILKVQKEIFFRESEREAKIAALIKEELGAPLAQGKAVTATDVAKEINDKTIQQVEAAARAQPNPPVPRDIGVVINQLNNTWHGREALRDEVHALIYEQAKILNNNKTIAENFSDKLAGLRNPANLHMRLDDKQTELERAIRSTTTVAKQAQDMDDKLKETKNLIESRLMIPPRDINQRSEEYAMNAVKEYKNSQPQQPALNAATPNENRDTVLNFLITKFNDPNTSKGEKEQLRLEIHAVAFQFAADGKVVGEYQTVLTDFNKKLMELRKNGFDDTTPTFFQNDFLSKNEWQRAVVQMQETLKTKEAEKNKTPELASEIAELQKNLDTLKKEPKYDALAFMEEAIKTEQKRNPHDSKIAKTTLEIFHDKLVQLHQEVEGLQKKANDTTNPIERDKLIVEAHRVLRLHGEIGDMLNQERIRTSLQASFADKDEHKKLLTYIESLEAQQPALIQIAGENKERYTPIPHKLFDTREEARTAMISENAGVCGNVAYKEFNKESGKWTDQILKSKKDGKPITGLALADIKAAITQTEIKLGLKVGTIELTGPKNGKYHYDAGNAHNRSVLHEEFVNAYDAKLDQKAKVDTKAEVQQYQPAAANAVQYSSPQPASADGSAAAAAASRNDTPARPVRNS